MAADVRYRERLDRLQQVKRSMEGATVVRVDWTAERPTVRAKVTETLEIRLMSGSEVTLHAAEFDAEIAGWQLAEGEALGDPGLPRERVARVLAWLLRNEGVDPEAIERAVLSVAEMVVGDPVTLGGEGASLRRAFVAEQLNVLDRADG